MAEAIYSALSWQLRFRWDKGLFVRLTIGAWRRTSTHGAVNGALLGYPKPAMQLTAPAITATSGQKLKNNRARKMFASSALPEKQPA
jgi:hypothetical protein